MKLCWRDIRPSFLKYNPKATAIPEIIPVVLICTAGIISAPSGCISILLFCYTEIISTVRMHLYLPLLLHRDYFCCPDASLSCSFAPQGLFRPAECISIFLFCFTGIISSGRMHLYLALLLHRDYFDRPDASLSSSFASQGLFPSARCISILLFCSTGIISAARMHLYLALLLHRDYFAPARCIPAFLFCPTGIIFTGRMHLYLPLLLHRDYFRRPDASLPSSFVPQGLFPPVGCISILLFSSTGIISTGRIHLYLPLLSHRDYFDRPDASLSCSFAPQGLFLPVGFIPSLLFCSTGIILLRSDASLSSSFASQGLFPPAGCISIFLFCFTGTISIGQMHPCLPLLSHRDYFDRPDASLPSSFVPQGLFPPAGFISILLFCSTGIISSGRMHLYLALLLHRDYFDRSDSSLPSSFAPQGLFCPGWMHLYLPLLLHRDYFCRPDSSPACSFVPQGLFRPAECISNPGSCKVSATKLLLHRKHSYGFC